MKNSYLTNVIFSTISNETHLEMDSDCKTNKNVYLGTLSLGASSAQNGGHFSKFDWCGSFVHVL